jgi:hypothetical protein
MPAVPMEKHWLNAAPRRDWASSLLLLTRIPHPHRHSLHAAFQKELHETVITFFVACRLIRRITRKKICMYSKKNQFLNRISFK